MNVKSALQEFPLRVAVTRTCWLDDVAAPVKSGVTLALPLGRVTLIPTQVRALPATAQVSDAGLGNVQVASVLARMCGFVAEVGEVPASIR
jgi:hypothetical protein